MNLSAIFKRKRTVLIFYCGGWCPHCNAYLADLMTIKKQAAAQGFQIIAISPDTPSELKKTRTKYHLNYKLFSDSSAEAMMKFGVAYRVDDPTFTTMLYTDGVDLEKSSGQTHHILPVAAVFVIGNDLTILFVDSNPDCKVRLKGSEILRVIASM